MNLEHPAIVNDPGSEIPNPPLHTAELERRVRAWATSDEGREALRRILADSERAQAAARKAREVDPATLNRPCSLPTAEEMRAVGSRAGVGAEEWYEDEHTPRVMRKNGINPLEVAATEYGEFFVYVHDHWPAIVAALEELKALKAQFKNVGIVPYLDRMRELATRAEKAEAELTAAKADNERLRKEAEVDYGHWDREPAIDSGGGA